MNKPLTYTLTVLIPILSFFAFSSTANAASWQDVTSSRSIGTTYTNTTGHALEVSISTYSGPSGTDGTYRFFRCALQISVNGVDVSTQFVNTTAGADRCNGTVIVPAGATYSMSNHSLADITLNKWMELQLADSATASWQDVTSSRSIGTTYTNTTGHALEVSIRTYSGPSGTDGTYRFFRCALQISVNGVDVSTQFVNTTAGADMCNGTVIVPAGATYSASNHGLADITLNKWLELQLADSTTASWQDVTSSRSIGTTYTNTTGHALEVSIRTYSGPSGTDGTYRFFRCALQISVNGVDVSTQFVNTTAGADMCNGTVIVPAGATYSMSNHSLADITLNKWLELQLADSTTALSCAITFDQNPIPSGGTTIRWSSSNAQLFYINSIGYVSGSGSASVAPSSSTDYSGYVNDKADGTGNTVSCAAALTVSGGQCPAGQTLQNGVCVSLCPVGYTFQNGACVFTACPAGYVLQGTQCVRSNLCTTPPHCSGDNLVNSCTGAISKLATGAARRACAIPFPRHQRHSKPFPRSCTPATSRLSPGLAQMFPPAPCTAPTATRGPVPHPPARHPLPSSARPPTRSTATRSQASLPHPSTSSSPSISFRCSMKSR